MSKLPYGGYTQREWERTVGWGKVPPEYEHEEPQYKLNDPIWDERWTKTYSEQMQEELEPIESDNDVQPQDDKSTRNKSYNN